VAVLAFDGVVLGDLATPLEILGRCPGYSVRVCSAKPRVRSEFVTLSVPWRLSALSRAHTIIVPGAEEPANAKLNRAELRALRRGIALGARVASICTGAFLLAQTGVLDGRRATTHWRGAALLARRHPRIEVDPDVLYVDAGRVLTSAGAAAGLDLCLYLIRKDFGATAAACSAREAVMPMERSGGQAQFIEHVAPAEDGLGSLLQWLEKHVAEDLSLAAIAKQAALSTRTLSRRFRERVGTTPAAWVAKARVRRAQQLLETSDQPVERIADAVGFRSATVLREHFARVLGTAPTQYRRAFQTRR
jgi:transcriptional regulator GlxA family with amidase domain